MPIIRVETGDLIKKFEQKQFFGIVHGCNCFHYMHAGIAGQLAKRYQAVRDADKSTDCGNLDKLGAMSLAVTEFGFIYNMYTQFKPGRENPEFLLRNIRLGFQNLNNILQLTNCLTGQKDIVIGIPRIGAGIAGGDWKEIESVINSVTPDLDIILVDYKPEAPDFFTIASQLGFMGKAHV